MLAEKPPMRITDEDHVKLIAEADALHTAAMVLASRCSGHADPELVHYLTEKAAEFRSTVNRMRPEAPSE